MKLTESLEDSTSGSLSDVVICFSKIRESLLPEKEYSEESMVSPESNETMERRHLKSILKKLSAEGSTSDEDQSFKMESKKRDNAELKKLLRAPTIEGYAARHKKLTKSVTFDRDTLSSPPEPETMASATPLEGAGNGRSTTNCVFHAACRCQNNQVQKEGDPQVPIDFLHVLIPSTSFFPLTPCFDVLPRQLELSIILIRLSS